MNTKMTENTVTKGARTTISKAGGVGSPLLLAFACSVYLIRPMPPWAFMWTVALLMFAECKWLTWRRAAAFAELRSRDDKVQVPIWIRAGYLLAWVGMD